MGQFVDLTGKQFGRLTVIRRGANRGSITRWDCVCECGNTACVDGTSLTRGRTQSCGCYRVDKFKENPNGGKHGGKGTRLYTIWAGMKQRCYYPKSINFSNYGGRGIVVCDEWRHDFQAFRDWALANGYRDDLTIDRIDVDGNYCPENCRWATRTEQDNNTGSNHRVTFNGETHTIAEWSRITGLDYSTLWRRICIHGWDAARALSTPTKPHK